MLKQLCDLIYQRVKPFATTQPVHLQWQSGAAGWLSWKPLRVLAGKRLAAGHPNVKVDVNERIVELPFVYGRLRERQRVLDVGCAESTLSISLASLGFQVTGVDLRSYPLKHPNFRFVQGDICRLPVPAGRYDAAICLSTLEHIGLDSAYRTSSPGASDSLALTAIHRALKPAGTLLLTVPTARTPHQTEFMRVYSPQQLKKLLKTWQIESLEYFAPDQDRSSWQSVGPAQLPRPPRFGVALVAARANVYNSDTRA